ncbi:Disease resistance protein L6 [Linum perenne]
MDQQRWPSIWPLAALSLAVAVFFLPKKRPGISKGTSPSSSQSKSPAENPISAPSSSSKYSLPVEYEVFLSFRGPDVRTTFADVLYKFLDRFKIRTFLDDEELRKGEKIAPSLTEAIKESKVYIPILSQGYASSKWCLQELALMVKWCKQGDDRIILPIFYMMEPRNVRHQEGSYKEAFRLHSKKYDAETIKEWKEALKEVGEMKGWSVKESDKQGDIIEKVYSKVWSHLLRSYKLVTDELVGIDSHVQQVTRLLTSDSEGMKVVGIHGMGGMGKTTIAKAVYNELYSQFDRFCFVEDAREILSKSEGIVALQSKIISSILRTDYKVTDASEGLHVIKDRVCKHKVLVVLDDVNNLFEFDQILGKLDNFSRESRFIVTTRDKRVLERNQLWMHDHIRDLGRAIVREEDSQRPWKRSRIWSNKDALNILKTGEGSNWVEFLSVDMKDEILELTDTEFKKLSGLRYLEVHNGILIGDFKGVLPNLRWLRLQHCRSIPSDLNMKKLVILEMERCPVEDEWRGWSGTKVASNLKAIHLHYCHETRTAPDLSQCRNLEWIDLEGCLGMSGEIHIGNLLKNLKLLRFSETNITKLTGEIGTLENLQVLDAGNQNLSEFPRDNGKLFSLKIMNMPTSLNKLTLSSSTRVLNLSELKDLEELCFDDCDKLQYLGGLWKLSKLRKLIMLETLWIDSAQNLINLDGLECLSHLNELWLKDCCVLEKLPVSLANLTKLQRLTIEKCTQLAELPDLSALANLRELDISGCTGLTGVMVIPRLELLTKLSMSGCSSVEELTDLSGLRNMVRLDISVCNKLKEVTAEVMSLERMDALRSLSMRNCTSITKFPDLSALTNLKTLDISGCVQLADVMGVGRLESLKSLVMSGCSSVEDLPDFSGLRNMASLDIKECNQLEEITGIESLELLKYLVMRNCTSIKKLPDLSGCKKLRRLDIRGCVQLAEVGGIERLESLKWLNMSGCSSVEELPDLSGLWNVNSLDISECNQLKEVTGIGSLELLEELVMRNCTSIKKLPDLSGCKELHLLDIRGCIQLAEVSGIDKLVGLKVFR